MTSQILQRKAMESSNRIDRTVGRVIAAVVGTTSCFATFVVLLLLAVWLTPPDLGSGSRAPGIALNVLFAAAAIAVGITAGRALFRRFLA